jgi:hypothetical protein
MKKFNRLTAGGSTVDSISSGTHFFPHSRQGTSFVLYGKKRGKEHKILIIFFGYDTGSGQIVHIATTYLISYL